MLTNQRPTRAVRLYALRFMVYGGLSNAMTVPPGRLTPAFLRFFFETHFFHALPYTTKKERSGALKLLCMPFGPICLLYTSDAADE